MSENSRPKRSKKRNESGIHGKHYERRVLSLIALKCFFDKDIKDFWILSNPQDVEKFDDIILFTEHQNGKNNLLMIQVKHKDEEKKHPVVANKLDDDEGKLSLMVYQKAYSDIMENKNFLKLHKVPGNTEMSFILFNNCQVHTDKESNNVGFCYSGTNSFKFINTSSTPKSILRIVNKSSKYNQSFLDQFYFYIEQIEDAFIEVEIETLLGINTETANVIIDFFYKWLNRKDDCVKLWKRDVATMLLDIVFGDFQPLGSLESINDCVVRNMIPNFDVTVIERENSAVLVWTEIFQEIKKYHDNVVTSTWEDYIPKTVEDLLLSHVKNSEFFFTKSGSITLKLLYIFMVANRQVPFFIKTTNKLFNSFKDKLLPALNIYSVVFNVNKEELSFLNTLKIFQDFSNVKKKLYYGRSKKLEISFQGKPDIDLYELTAKHKEVKQAISVDSYIELLREKYTIGGPRSLPEYYVNRQISIPIFNATVFKENDYIFFIFNFPIYQRMKNYKQRQFLDYLFKSSDENYEELDHIITTHIGFNTSIPIRLVEPIARHRTYYILKYIDEDLFQFVYSNGSIEPLRPHLTYIPKPDAQLTHIYRTFNVNIISNNAGMGKTMLLNFLHSQLPSDDWVIYIDLKKYGDKIKRLKTVEDLINFSYHCQTEDISENFHIFLKKLYKKMRDKIVWLIDDYEEVNEPGLLKLFESASTQGFRIWIAVRPYLKLEFEQIFRVFSMEIRELNKDDQKVFIERYLKQKHKSEDDIERIMTDIDSVRHLLQDSFIGTCQQTMMLTEIFLNHHNREAKEKWCIDDIYEEFLKLKVSNNLGANRDWYIRTISKLALKVFFKDEALNKVFDLEEFEEDVNIFKANYPKDFFITGFGESDVPIFSHMTYAEFLAARWLLLTVRKQLKGKTPFNMTNIFRLLHLNELTTVRLFFDNMVTKRLPLHSAIVNNDLCKILELVDEDTDLLGTDFLGRSIFHLLSNYGSSFDVGVDAEANRLVRNLDAHLKITDDGKDILLHPVEQVTVNKSNARIIRNLSQISALDCPIGILKRDTLLNLNSADQALLSGSLVELDTFLEVLNSAIESPLSLPEEMKYCLLFYSIKHRYKNILSSLNVIGSNKLKIGLNKVSLLHLAVASKNLAAIKKLATEHSLSDWGVDADGNTPLHVACHQMVTSVVEFFFAETDIDTEFLNKTNFKGQSHLHFLARKSSKKLLERIITNYPGLNIDSKSSDGNTPFILSIIFNNIHTARILLAKGANVNHCNRKSISALHYAASKGFLNCVKKLVSWNANVNHQDFLGKTPLMKASRWGHKDVVKLLLAKKAKTDLCDNNKWTALHCAVRGNHLEIIDLLLKYGADVNCINKKNESPLVIACQHDLALALRLLLSCKGIHIAKSALKISIRKKHKKCIDLLLQARANL